MEVDTDPTSPNDVEQDTSQVASSTSDSPEVIVSFAL